ncbi:sulfite oxidase heme-binding subunit YedZ [Alteromonas sp. H39]|uniref:sulfite oxidase heme-binding subunit YedZ n=1 Tax=Alteromonas sp. H39 TaxID=3389876 RepID=UPI0039E0EA96
MVLTRLFKKPVTLSGKKIIAAKALIHLAILLHIATLFYLGVTDNLGADPVKALLHTTGTWSVHLLLVTLLVSPLAKWLPFPGLMRFRRLLGIYSFVYALVHFLTYCAFEIQFDWSLIISEIAKRPYITVGFTALILLLLLTVTSPNRIRRLLGARWQTLHNSIYLIGMLALLHFTWSQKTLFGDSLFYWGVLIVLLVIRRDKLIKLTKPARKGS